jgi:hypothetical protein
MKEFIKSREQQVRKAIERPRLHWGERVDIPARMKVGIFFRNVDVSAVDTTKQPRSRHG